MLCFPAFLNFWVKFTSPEDPKMNQKPNARRMLTNSKSLQGIKVTVLLSKPWRVVSNLELKTGNSTAPMIWINDGIALLRI